MSSSERDSPLFEGVAIVGMSGRFPGARNVAEFWNNQRNGIEAISQFKVEDLEITNATDATLNSDYVPARSVLEDVDLFDAEFFGIYPREAELMDPQHRLFLECCWQAIEDAGYDQSTYRGSIGVYAGCSMCTYFLSQLCTEHGFIQEFTGGYQVSHYPEMLGNSLDFLSTRVSYKLNLRGPSFTIQSACSTSLLAVTQACQSLLTYQCDMALAGGSSITFPQKRGASYQEGGMISLDGHCRTFDADAQGTVFGSGVAVVLLKRLEEAVRDGDQIYAVIRGFAVNNDGSAKVGYTAPSVEGQSRVIALAQEAAGVGPESIGYIEAHGTATPLGDPIELTALAQAFRTSNARTQRCTIGAAKTNVGHLDVAAGVTGLIHATHIVRHGVFPPTLHFKKPNHNFDLTSSPFRINTKLSEWTTDGTPRRAGVSSFGVGGTNAHVVIEQAPQTTSSPSTRPAHLLVLSARSEVALERATDNLDAHLKAEPDVNLADVAWTLQIGRRVFPWKRTIVARNVDDAISALSQRDRNHVQTRLQERESPKINFLFPGQGSQYPDMGRELYQTEPVFREAVDRCAEILRPHLDADIRTMLYPPEGATDELKRRVTDTVIAQPSIFATEYALARLWMSWGVRPDAMLGHSIGEFVAACLAEVFSLEDALVLVAARGRLMQDIPNGGMLSVRLPEAEARKRLNGTLSLAAVNSPSLCVVAGPFDALETFEQQLGSEGVPCRRLVTSHAFHSAMIDPMIEPFMAILKNVSLRAPQIPYVSGVSGTWITAEQATDPSYWARHAREPVQFSAGVMELRKDADAILLEVGPGNTLNTLARQHTGSQRAGQIIVSSLADGSSGIGDATSLMSALGSLWLAGVQVDWSALYGQERRQRISLPTYPFERKRYWLDAAADQNASRSEPLMTADIAPFSTEENEPVNMMATVPGVGNTAVNFTSRTDQIRTALVESLSELAGMDFAALDSSTTFLEMGLDSLFLTQVTLTLQNKFGLKITLRQLLGDESTLAALTQYIDGELPAEFFTTTVPTQPAAVPSPLPSGASGMAPPSIDAATLAKAARLSTPDSAVERLMREQHQAMNELFAKQLETLRGVAPTATVVPPINPLPVTSQSTASSATTTSKTEFKAHGPYRPVQKSSSSELTERQKTHLNELIDRWTKRTSSSKRMTQEYRGPLADPRVVSGFRQQWKEMVYPIITERSQGSRIWDVDGNEYIDLVNGFGPIMLGHRPDFVENAIAKQLHEGFETGPQTPLAGKVAKLFCEMTGNERMSFCNTGSEGVLAALRVARTVTGRNKVVSFAGDYHGLFDEVLVKGVKNKNGTPEAAPVAPGIPRESVANMIVLDYAQPESLDWIRQNAKELAAVLVEPVQSRHPDLQPVEFLKELREITQKSGTALIFDEVVTGFRVHPGGCQALFGIRADLAIYGKAVAGGMPIGILAGKSEFMDALDGGMWRFGDDSYPEVGVTFFAGTFVRHPLTIAAMKAVLEHFKEQGPSLQERLTEQTLYLVRMLKEFAAQLNVLVRIESFGSIFYVSFPTEERFASLFYYYMRDKGVHVREGFPCFLTTAHTDADIKKIAQAFKDSMVEMQDAGFLSTPASSTGVVTQSKVDVREAHQAPMTESQLEVWLSDQICTEASCSYNESSTLHLRGVVNESALDQALQAVVGRHDALRASFDGDKILQRFAEKPKLIVPIVDLTQLSETDRANRLKQIIDQEARTPFSLSEGPLVRAQLIRIEDQYRQLIFTAHHIVCDGWSTNVLLDELAQLYNAATRGTTCDLPAPMSFATYAQSQAEFLNSPDGAKVERYWLEQFEHPAPLLDLPIDRVRPAVKEYNGATYRKKIGAEAYGRIKKLGASQKCTLFVTLLASFQMLLNRLSGQDDIVVGIPTAGQSLLDDATLVGHCVNFIPLRGRPAGDQTAAEFLAQMKRTVLAGYEHQNYTYGRLVRKLALQRDPSRLPLTEVQFNLERVGSGLSFDGCEAEFDPNPKSFVNFDIFLNIIESKNGLVLDCDYNSGLFGEETIARWLNYYEVLLEGLVADVNTPISRLPLLTHTERQHVREYGNNTHIARPAEMTVHRLFEAKVKETPDAIAVEFEEKRLSYAELDGRANQLANYLRRIGVKRGVLVGVFVERSLDMIVALLAVLKAGGAYVPMDPTFPPERLCHVLEDAKVSFVLTQTPLIERWSFGDARVVQLDSNWPSIARESAAKPKDVIAADDLAYVIYTSGSTGKPKGVEILHRSLTNLLQAMQVKPGLDKTDVLAAVTTLSFDIAGLELYLPLCVGAKLVIVSRETASYAVRLIDCLTKIGATVMQATPVTWKQLIEAGWNGAPALKVLCGGEEFPRELANELVKRSSSVWNMYGPTETTIWSAAREVTAGDGPVPIGPPIANTRFYVLDKNFELVPMGVAGELCIAGDGLARGYLNRAELTAEKFLIDPFSEQPGARLYRTGDLVRRRNDGALEFLGRLDDQIKLRGFRIELGEIQSVLASHPAIAQAIVSLRQDEPGDKRLVAYLVAAAGSIPTATELRDFLLQKLPDYMIPAAYIPLLAVPLTPNGKIDRRALPAPDWSERPKSTTYVSPRTTEEETLARIWAEILHIDQIGVNDNVFELGADSLHVFQIAARAVKAGISVTPRQILQHRTIAAIIAHIAKSPNTKQHAPGTIRPVPRQKFSPTEETVH